MGTYSVPGEVRPKSSLLRSGVHSFVTSVISVILSIASSIVVARSLGPAAKGSADLILATTVILTMVFGLSLQSGITYVVAQGRAVIRRLFIWLTLIALIQTLLAVGVLWALLSTDLSVALIPPGSASWAVGAIALLVLVGLAAGHLRGILTGLQEILLVNNVNLFGQIFGVVIVVVMVGLSWASIWRFSASTFIWTQVVTAVAIAVALLWALKPHLTPAVAQASGLREVIAFSMPSYFANLVQTLNYRLDIFFVSYFVGVQGVGLYSLAVGLAQLLWLVSGAASQVLFPNVAASNDRAASQERTARISRLSFWLSIVLACGVAVLGDMFLPMIYGVAFRESVPALLWLLPGVVVFSIANVIGSFLAGIGKPHLNLAVALIGLIATITLDFALIPWLGIVGAAIASSVSYLVTTIAIVYFFARETKLSLWSAIVLTQDDLVLLLATMRQIARRTHAA